MEKYTNSLINESSPYLLQHAHNPVNWLAWGEEALSKAKKENKMIFVSIGYAACHWCHVMEKESFENTGLAELLNRNFICIKVDREERPDIDQVYMSAVQLMTGRGGWPLNCFATPDARPFYGGTYFPPSQLTSVVNQIRDTWQNEPQKIFASADSMYEGIVNSELIKEKLEKPAGIDPADIYQDLAREFDREEGGMRRVPKFPMPGIYTFLLHYSVFAGNTEAIDHVMLTVDKMTRGGIYDQLSGGIARYSTDRNWLVPHFEKMLYDNARFISLLSNLYSITRNKNYREILYECNSFMENELGRKEGGYYASIDADTHNEEGKYYAWDKTEIDVIADDHSDLISDYWGITHDGNWEAGKNVLAVRKEPEELARTYGMKTGEVKEIIASTASKLRSYRELREKPAVDTKILTSWNALAVLAFADSWQATGDDVFLEKAINTGRFIRDNLIKKDYTVKRSLSGATGGFLDDYAFCARAFLSLYQCDFEESWLHTARKLTEKMISDFFNIQTGMFYYASALETDMPVRQTEVADHVLPSSNAVLANVLFQLSRYFEDVIFERIARQMISNVTPYLQKTPAFFPVWADLFLTLKEEPCEIVITGPECQENRKNFTGRYLPGVIFAGASEKSEIPLFTDRFAGEKNRIYVCRGGMCKLPVETAEEALDQLS